MPISKKCGLVRSSIMDSILAFQHPSEYFFWQLVEWEKVPQNDWKNQIHQYMLKDCITKISFKYSGYKYSDDLYECYVEIVKIHGYDSPWWGACGVALKLLASSDKKLQAIKNVAVKNLLLSTSVKHFRSSMKAPRFWNGVILPYWRLNQNPTLIYDDLFRWKRESRKVSEFIKFLGDPANKKRLMDNQTPTAMLFKSVLEDLCKNLYPLALKINQKHFLLRNKKEFKNASVFVLSDCLERNSVPIYYLGTKDEFANEASIFLKYLESLSHGEIKFPEESFEAFLGSFFDSKDLLLSGISSIFKDVSEVKKNEVSTDLNWYELRAYPFNSYDEEKICECVKKVSEQLNKKTCMGRTISNFSKWKKFLNFSDGLSAEQKILIEPYLARGLLEALTDEYISKWKLKKKLAGKGLTKRVAGVLANIVRLRKEEDLNKLALSLWQKSETIVDEINDYAHSPFTVERHVTESMITFSYRFMLVVLA